MWKIVKIALVVVAVVAVVAVLGDDELRANLKGLLGKGN